MPTPGVTVSAITVDRLKKFSEAIRIISPDTLTVSFALSLEKTLDSLLDKSKAMRCLLHAILSEKNIQETHHIPQSVENC